MVLGAIVDLPAPFSANPQGQHLVGLLASLSMPQSSQQQNDAMFAAAG